MEEARGPSLEVSQIKEPLSPEEVLELLDQAPKVSKFPTQPSVIHDLIFSFLPFNTPPLCRKFSSEYMKKTCTPPRQPHGVLETYYPDPRRKQIKSRVPYWDGELHGVARYWDVNGKLIVRTSYREGVRHGKSEKWEEGGGFRERFFQRGDLHGVSTSIQFDGIRWETLYQEDEIIESRLFGQEDHLIMIESHHLGHLATKYLNSGRDITSMLEYGGRGSIRTYYNSDGGITTRVTINLITRRTQEEEFYPSGQIRTRTTRNQLTGEVQVERWDENGTLEL